MTRDRAIDVVRKLLELSGSSNENESRSAKRRADALKRKYKIRQAEIRDAPPRDVDAGGLGADPYWRVELARVVADRERVVAAKRDGRLRFEGERAERATRLYARLSNEIVAACQRTWRAEVRGVSGSLYVVWSTTFKAEVVRAIASRLSGVEQQTLSRSAVQGSAPYSPQNPSPEVFGVVSPSYSAPYSPQNPSAGARPAASTSAGGRREGPQLDRAQREVAVLVSDFAWSMGEFAARELAAAVVRRAAVAGETFGREVYLGAGERLLPGRTAARIFYR